MKQRNRPHSDDAARELPLQRWAAFRPSRRAVSGVGQSCADVFTQGRERVEAGQGKEVIDAIDHVQLDSTQVRESAPQLLEGSVFVVVPDDQIDGTLQTAQCR